MQFQAVHRSWLASHINVTFWASVISSFVLILLACETINLAKKLDEIVLLNHSS